MGSCSFRVQWCRAGLPVDLQQSVLSLLTVAPPPVGNHPPHWLQVHQTDTHSACARVSLSMSQSNSCPQIQQQLNEDTKVALQITAQRFSPTVIDSMHAQSFHVLHAVSQKSLH